MITKRIYRSTENIEGKDVVITNIELLIFGVIIKKTQYFEPFVVNSKFEIKL